VIAKKRDYIADFCVRVLSSKRFLLGVILLFVMQASWIAFSNKYPMVYDEQYHIGVTRVYTHQASPFIRSQNMDTAPLGDVTRSVSYLSHYVESVPLRIADHATKDPYFQVVSLRLINIGLVVIGILFYLKLFDLVKIPKKFSNIAIFFLVFTPGFVYTAANVNYDNAIFALTPICFFLMFRILKKSDITDVLLLSVILILTCLVKVTFLLPSVLIGLLLLVHFIRFFKKENIKTYFKRSIRKANKYLIIALVICNFFALFLMTERYAINIIKYHAINVPCERLHSTEFCSQNWVWERGRIYKQQASVVTQPFLVFVGKWSNGIMSGFFGMPNNSEEYFFTSPLPVLNFAVWVIIITSLIGFIKNHAKIIRNYNEFSLLLFISASYIFTVFIQNYRNYLGFGRMVAVQGRYFFFVAPVIYVFMVISISLLVSSKTIKTVMLCSAALVFFQGGVVSYIVLSRQSWYWDKHKIVWANNSMKKILTPIVKENRVRLNQTYTN
jgi:hypothetical protein